MPEPSDLALAKARFILKGGTLKAWCRQCGIDPGYAHKALTGQQAGPKAQQLRKRILDASLADAA